MILVLVVSSIEEFNPYSCATSPHHVPSKKIRKFLVGVELVPTLIPGEGLGQAQGLPLPYFRCWKGRLQLVIPHVPSKKECVFLVWGYAGYFSEPGKKNDFNG